MIYVGLAIKACRVKLSVKEKHASVSICQKDSFAKYHDL